MKKKYKCPYCDFVSDSKVKVHRHVYSKSDSVHNKFGKVPSGYKYEDIIEIGGDSISEEVKEINKPINEPNEDKYENKEISNGEYTTEETKNISEEKEEKEVEQHNTTEHEQTKTNIIENAKPTKPTVGTIPEADIIEKINNIKVNSCVLSDIIELRTKINELNVKLDELNKRLDIHKEVINKILELLGA